MNRTQKYICLLLERLPKYELRSYEHQTNLDRIRDRVSNAPDINAELLYLYQVQGCAEFALSLMWIADKVEKDTTKEESTIDEETLVFSKFRQAMGDTSPSVPGGPVLDFPGLQGFESSPTPQAPSSLPELESIPTSGTTLDVLFSTPAPVPDRPKAADSGSTSGNEQQRSFAALLEHFLESVQSGNDDRSKLLTDILNESNKVLALSSATEDYKQFCRLLIEFLQYISNNQYLDDVRVMNILSNIQDPFTQWARGTPENQAGVLDSVNDILRDFKAMFE